MPRGGGYDVTGLAVKVTREGVDEASRDLKQLAKAADGAETQVDELGKESKETSRALKDLDQKTASAGASMSGMAKTLVTAAAAFAALRGLSSLMRESIEASAAQEKVFKMLDVGLKNVGVSYASVSGELDTYFAMLQKTTTYGDDQSAEALRSLVVVTGDYDSALQLLEPTLQFASAMNLDLATAARLAGQAATGMTGTLSRYGIVLDATTKKLLTEADAADKAAIVADMLNARFTGSAQAELDTYGGKVDQLTNYWGDFQERLGDVYTMMATNSGAFDAIIGSLETLTEWVNKFAVGVLAIKQFGAQVNLDVSTNAISQLNKEIEHYAKLATTAGDHGSKYTDKLRELYTELAAAERVQRDANKAWDDAEVTLDRLARGEDNLTQHTKELLGLTPKLTKATSDLAEAEKKAAQYAAPFITAQLGLVEAVKEGAGAFSILGENVDTLANAIGNALAPSTIEAEKAIAALDAGAEGAQKPIKELAVVADGIFDDIERSFSSMLGKGFTGELESFADLWEEIWKDLAKSMTGMLTDAFSDWLQGGKLDEAGEVIPGTGGFMQSLEGMTAGQRVGMGLGGAGMVYQGAQQGGTGGVIQGMMGGASAGLALAGGTFGASVIVGAIVGGLAAYFGGGKEDQPWTDIQRLGPGAAWQGGEAGIATRGQDMTAREDRMVSMGLGAIYRNLSDQWRDMARGFGDSELFELLGEMPEIVDQSFQMTAQEVEKWLSEDKLPILFQRQYGRAIRTGLRNLGMTSDAMGQLFDEIRDMPGTERLAALNSVIAALRISSEMIAMDWEAINVEVGKTAVEQWADGMVEAGEQMELLTAGWEEMSLVDRASDLEQIGGIFETVTQSTISMLQQLEQIARSLDSMFAATIEGFTVRGMDEPELWSYYEERYNYYNNLLATTDDPNLIIEYTQQMLRVLNSASGILTDEEWQAMAGTTGMTFQEWFLSVTRDAQAAADAAVQEQQSAIQARYDVLWEQMVSTGNEFNLLSTAAENLVEPLEQLPPSIDDVIDGLGRFRNALDSTAAVAAEKGRRAIS